MKEILILGNIRSRSIIYLLANKNNDIFRRQLRIRQGEIGPKFTHAHFHQRHVLALANSRSVYRSVADELRAMVETSSKHENKTEAEKRVERERERERKRERNKRGSKRIKISDTPQIPDLFTEEKKRGGIVPGIHHEEAHDSPCIMQ